MAAQEAGQLFTWGPLGISTKEDRESSEQLPERATQVRQCGVGRGSLALASCVFGGATKCSSVTAGALLWRESESGAWNPLQPVFPISLRALGVLGGGGGYAAVDCSGELWSAPGSQHPSQLGRALMPCSLPTSCPGPVASLSAGWGHFLALGESGWVLAWGDNSHGQCGCDPGGQRSISDPQQVPLPPAACSLSDLCRTLPAASAETVSAAQVSAGAFHSAVLTKCGDVLTWGGGRHGQLGTCSPMEAAAELGSSEHTLHRQPTTGALLRWQPASWLQSEQGVFDAGSCVPQHVTLPLESGDLPRQVACRQNTTVVLSEQGAVWGWGQHVPLEVPSAVTAPGCSEALAAIPWRLTQNTPEPAIHASPCTLQLVDMVPCPVQLPIRGLALVPTDLPDGHHAFCIALAQPGLGGEGGAKGSAARVPPSQADKSG